MERKFFYSGRKKISNYHMRWMRQVSIDQYSISQPTSQPASPPRAIKRIVQLEGWLGDVRLPVVFAIVVCNQSLRTKYPIGMIIVCDDEISESKIGKMWPAISQLLRYIHLSGVDRQLPYSGLLDYIMKSTHCDQRRDCAFIKAFRDMQHKWQGGGGQYKFVRMTYHQGEGFWVTNSLTKPTGLIKLFSESKSLEWRVTTWRAIISWRSSNVVDDDAPAVLTNSIVSHLDLCKSYLF